MDNKERFVSLCKTVDRDGMNELLDWLETTDFYTAPASTKYHGAYEGGLLEHSLNVYDELERILAAFPEIGCDEESIVICSLFHDFCKIGMYKPEKRNRKNAFGKWESYDGYCRDEDFRFGGHGSKSVYLVQQYMKLTQSEAAAINCHMSAFDNKDVGEVFDRNPFAWAVSVADQAATYIKEGGVK